MSDIFREVDEALQREKAAQFWKEYGPTLIGCIFVIILSTAAMTGYRNWDNWRDEQETSKLIAATTDKDIAAAMEKAAAQTRKGHEAVALMTAAGVKASSKDFAAAAKLYDEITQDKSTPDDLRDLATVLYVRSAMLANAGKPVDYKAMLDKLVPVAKNDKSVFQLQAKLDAALLYGDGLKDYASALDLLKGFEDANTSDSMKGKADALKHVYEFERSKSPKA